jgi:hypothetical protein
LIGTKAKVLLQARLFNQNCLISVKVLKQSKVTVSILNHQDINSSFEISPIEWDHKNEYVLEVPVQTYLKVVTINVSANVDMYTGKPA